MKQLLIVIVLLLANSAWAQKAKIAANYVKNAELLINNGNYAAAVGELQAAIATKDDYSTAYKLLGLVQLRQNNFDKAIEAYQKSFELNPKLSLCSYFECAEAYHKGGKHLEAVEYYELFKMGNVQDFSSDDPKSVEIYRKSVDACIRNSKFCMTQNFDAMVEKAVNLGPNINSPADEYMPGLSYDGELMVYTSRNLDENLFISKRKNNGNWTAGEAMKEINSDGNEGMGRLSPCGRTLYLTLCNRPEGNGGCDLYSMDLNGIGFENLRNLKGSLNDKSWDSQPGIDCSGSVMYFASNRPGGFGGTDIWVSRKQANGSWSNPENLGPTINTDQDEESPFIATDGVTLYFASAGLPGYGDADIFRTVLRDGAWTKPENMGRSINSPWREVGFTLNHDGSEAFFASSKPKDNYGGLDIYKVGIPLQTAPAKAIVLLSGTVYGEDGQALAAKIKINKSGQTIAQGQADANGKFFYCLPDDQLYSMVIDHNGYETYVNAERFKSSRTKPSVHVDVVLYKNYMYEELKTKTVAAGTTTVYFESGSTILKDDQVKRVKALLDQYPDKSLLNVKLVGFADEKGNQEMNQKLSKERADKLATIFIAAGVPQSQIFAIGKGIAQDEAVSLDQQRRVEIYIE